MSNQNGSLILVVNGLIAKYSTKNIYPYYYIDKGTKTNGISIGTGEVGTTKSVQW
jgi:hypothetical protein|nr:MAG TPA: hypothetical protein [Bacteriophage sp.]